MKIENQKEILEKYLEFKGNTFQHSPETRKKEKAMVDLFLANQKFKTEFNDEEDEFPKVEMTEDLDKIPIRKRLKSAATTFSNFGTTNLYIETKIKLKDNTCILKNFKVSIQGTYMITESLIYEKTYEVLRRELKSDQHMIYFCIEKIELMRSI